MERLACPHPSRLGTLLDGMARHTEEGYAFAASAARDGFRAAVHARDEPFATDPASHPGSPDGVVAKSSGCDYGPSTFKG